MKERRYYKKLVIVIVLMLSVMIGNVYAETRESEHKTQTVYGYKYTYFADIKDTYQSLRAGTYVGSNRVAAPGGYMGALARVYDSNGVLYASGDWTYNRDGLTGMNVPTYAEHNGDYYSYGKVRLYNGNGYNEDYTKRSPIMNLNLGSIVLQVNNK